MKIYIAGHRDDCSERMTIALRVNRLTSFHYIKAGEYYFSWAVPVIEGKLIYLRSQLNGKDVLDFAFGAQGVIFK